MIQHQNWRIKRNWKWTEDVEMKSPRRIIVLNLLYRRRDKGVVGKVGRWGWRIEDGG
jgi:hypothetical protein